MLAGVRATLQGSEEELNRESVALRYILYDLSKQLSKKSPLRMEGKEVVYMHVATSKADKHAEILRGNGHLAKREVKGIGGVPKPLAKPSKYTPGSVLIEATNNFHKGTET